MPDARKCYELMRCELNGLLALVFSLFKALIELERMRAMSAGCTSGSVAAPVGAAA